LPSTLFRVFENTIFGRDCQMRANSSSYSVADGVSSAVSQYTIVSYSRRPQRCTPSSRVCSLWNRCSSSSGADQSISPLGPAMKPSSETPIE
jgi:hypothetical protein